MLKNRLAIFFPCFPGMISIIEEFAEAGKNDLVYDLGSGDGRVLEPFAKRGVNCVGVDHNRLLNKVARRRLEYKDVEIVQGDIFDQDLSKATVVIAYLSRFVTKDLQKKIKQECKKGTKIILVSYKFDDWKPVKMKRWFWLPMRLYLL